MALYSDLGCAATSAIPTFQASYGPIALATPTPPWAATPQMLSCPSTSQFSTSPWCASPPRAHSRPRRRPDRAGPHSPPTGSTVHTHPITILAGRIDPASRRPPAACRAAVRQRHHLTRRLPCSHLLPNPWPRRPYRSMHFGARRMTFHHHRPSVSGFYPLHRGSSAQQRNGGGTGIVTWRRVPPCPGRPGAPPGTYEGPIAPQGRRPPLPDR